MKAAARASPREPDNLASIGVGLWVRLVESHNLMLVELRRRLADDCPMPRFDLLANLARDILVARGTRPLALAEASRKDPPREKR